jgi:hypothetical protein
VTVHVLYPYLSFDQPARVAAIAHLLMSGDSKRSGKESKDDNSCSTSSGTSTTDNSTALELLDDLLFDDGTLVVSDRYSELLGPAQPLRRES